MEHHGRLEGYGNVTSTTARSGQRGMTLIEVLVVVGIMAIASAAMGVVLTSAYRKASFAKRYGGAAAHSPDENVPDVRNAVVRVSLEPTEHASGLSRYRAHFDGSFVFASTDGKPSSLWFPFPNTAEATDVRLTFADDSGEHEPPNVAYTPGGVGWTGVLREETRVHVTYAAVGNGLFDFGLPQSQRIEHLDVRASGHGLSAAAVPDTSLRPTEVQSSTLMWRYDNLVTDRAITLELPRSLSPLGRTLLMCKLAAVAVLIFGAGFWYFGELDEPGRLDRFRWGHFLLLAATLSLFFLVFALVGLQAEMSPGSSLALSASLSLPLLVLHVSRIFDMRFALVRALPLAIYSLAIVGIGVFGGSDRPAAFVAAVVVGVSCVTWTYRRWFRGREAQRQLHDRQCERLARESKLDTLTTDLAAAIDVGLAVRAAAPPTDAVTDATLLPIATELEHRVALLDARLETARDLVANMQDARHLTSPEHRVACATWRVEASTVRCALDASRERANETLERLADRSEELHRRRRATDVHESERFCMACGTPLSAGVFCAGCGVRQCLDIGCESCHEPAHFPVHFMHESWRDQSIHCESCGDQLAT